jgi:hypothetical protein
MDFLLSLFLPRSLSETAVMLTTAALASVCFDVSGEVGSLTATLKSNLPFAVLLALGVASLIFGVWNPELIAAAFGQN